MDNTSNRGNQLKQFLLLVLFIFTLFLNQCATSNQRRSSGKEQIPKRESLIYNREQSAHVKTFYGNASYYAEEFHGRKTASGEIYNMNEYTAAHRTLPFGTVCRITNLKNQKSVLVRINDRGPFVADRIIDLSKAAAKAIDGIHEGIINVKIEILNLPN